MKKLFSWKSIGKALAGSLIGLGLVSAISGIGAIGGISTALAVGISSVATVLAVGAVAVAGVAAVTAVIKGAVSLVKGIINRFRNPEAAKERRQARKLAREQRRQRAKELKQEKKNILAQAKETLKDMDPQWSKKDQKRYMKMLNKLLRKNKIEEARNSVNQLLGCEQEVQEEVVEQEVQEEVVEQEVQEEVVEQEVQQEEVQEEVVEQEVQQEPVKVSKPRFAVKNLSQENQTVYKEIIKNKTFENDLRQMNFDQISALNDSYSKVAKDIRKKPIEEITAEEARTLATYKKINKVYKEKKSHINVDEADVKVKQALENSTKR